VESLQSGVPAERRRHRHGGDRSAADERAVPDGHALTTEAASPPYITRTNFGKAGAMSAFEESLPPGRHAKIDSDDLTPPYCRV